MITVDWPWAPIRLSRAVLESMYFWGELIIHHKVHTRKVYDLASRHIPKELLESPEPNPGDEQYHDLVSDLSYLEGDYGNEPYSIAVIHGGPGAPGGMAPVARELSLLLGVTVIHENL